MNDCTADAVFVPGEDLETSAMTDEATACYRAAAHRGHEGAEAALRRLGLEVGGRGS